ncbi:hypothetical protein OS493_002199 [Desmophyllum pertusum]|uniref:Uncharacterized protein n=1 Tax=Desmophyllum pertusum TaxID=174260 RepID=A0A9X0CTF4_9CNID|nr:hypothetical protein OS493_002199 [Desmophyllum pertusum]
MAFQLARLQVQIDDESISGPGPRGGDSSNPTAGLRVRIDGESISGPGPQGGDSSNPTGGFVGENAGNGGFLSASAILNSIALGSFKHIDPSPPGDIFAYLQCMENMQKMFTQQGNLVSTVECSSLVHTLYKQLNVTWM